MATPTSGRSPQDTQSSNQSQTDKSWLNCRCYEDGTIMKPNELEKEMKDPPSSVDSNLLNRIHGSMLGMALGDALGAFVEFRPRAYMKANPVENLKGGGTWGLEKGQFTDDTSMGLCLASSLVVRRDYVPYDQLVRYKWWHQKGYMSSTGACFDIGAATKQSLVKFEKRQKQFAKEHQISPEEIDSLSNPELLDKFDANCSDDGVAGNGALMRLTPVPLFFHRDPVYAIKCSGHSGEITHGDEKAYDACRYYGALIVAALQGASRKELLDKEFYEKNEKWFDDKPLHPDIMKIARGSYQKKEGYDGGIRGKGYIVDALEAALWAFWSDKDDFETGVLAAVNLGDDTDTTAAIYGQLAGAFYGFKKLPEKWTKQVYAKGFIECLSKWIVYEGEQWSRNRATTSSIPIQTAKSPSEASGGSSSSKKKTNSNKSTGSTAGQRRELVSSEQNQTVQQQSVTTSEQPNDPKTKFRPRRFTVAGELFTSQMNSHGQDAETRPTSSKEQDLQSPTSKTRVYFHKRVKSCEDVCKWLEWLSDEYKVYVKAFKDGNVDGYWLLNQLDKKQLIIKGVKNESHQQDILLAIDELKKECPIEYAFPNKEK